MLSSAKGYKAGRAGSIAGIAEPRPLRRLTVKAVTFVYRRAAFLACELDTAAEPAAERAHISILAPEDLPAYAAFRPGRAAEDAGARFERGDHCFAVWDDDRIVHASWVATRRVYVPYLHREMALLPGDVYTYDVFTGPPFRRRGLAAAGFRGVHRHFRSLGYRRSTLIVAAENEAGFGLVRATGYLPLGRYVCVRFGPWKPCWHQSSGPEQLPRLFAAADARGVDRRKG